VFVDPIIAPPELYVFGSGNDAAPVSELAAAADFRVTVVAFRGGRADPAAFPEADRVVSASAPRVGDDLTLDEATYAVVMSHNFVDDRLAVEALLDTQVPYVGVMGPESRFERMRDAFAEAGRPLTDADLERLYAPIGLDIGGGAPYQIAMSIVSEVLTVHNERDPRHLRERASPIHGRPPAE
jgi:xanthine dehydrogenase accessory factor